jgi:hypothetical protein
MREALHGVWAVSDLRPGGRAELRYAPFDEKGHLPLAPLAIREFASAWEARLVADLYEAAQAPTIPEDLEDSFLSGTGEIEILGLDGRFFLLSCSGEAVILSRVDDGTRAEWARLDQPRAPGGGPEYPPPPNHPVPARLDLAIMFRLVHATGAAH